jgi:cellulose biosynthesis protein BcsQ
MQIHFIGGEKGGVGKTLSRVVWCSTFCSKSGTLS